MDDDRALINLGPLFPEPVIGPSREYAEFMRVRQRILDIIRQASDEKTKVVDDIADALLLHDHNLPTDLLSVVLAVFGTGKKVYERRRRRELYRKIVNSLLEQLFDPALEFKMSKKDILDCFDAHGIIREQVSPQQVTQIYVRVIHKLRVGELRDLTWEEELHRYVGMKLREINLSRQDWELNGR